MFYVFALVLGLLHEYSYYIFSEGSVIYKYFEPILDIANLPIVVIPAFLLSLTDLIYTQRNKSYGIILFIITGALVTWKLFMKFLIPILFILG